MGKTEIVRLSWSEANIAAGIGVLRQITNLRDGRKDAHGVKPDAAPFEKHILGCQGEMAVAKFFGVYWTGSLGNLGVADVGQLQVRATGYMSGRLVTHRSDADGDIWICARVKLPEVHLPGWLYGTEAKQERYWQELPAQPGRPAFFADNADLRTMASLKDLRPVHNR